MRFLNVLLAAIAALVMSASGPVFAGVADVSNQADVNHPNIHQKVGGGKDGPRRNANPNGSNDRGAGLHGIGNNPGKSGSHPNDDGVNGQANELETMHGGIGDVNKNADQ